MQTNKTDGDEIEIPITRRFVPTPTVHFALDFKRALSEARIRAVTFTGPRKAVSTAEGRS
jgi:hypothetical protein